MTPVRSAGGERAVSRVHLVPGGDATGTLHSVFAAACNLAIDGTLVTVHDVSAAHTPISVRVRPGGTGAWAPRARAGDPARLRSGVLSFGAHAFDLRPLPVWVPGSCTEPVDLAAVARLTEDVVCARARHLSGRALPAGGLGAWAEDLRAALLTAPTTSPEVDGAIRRLIGFGPGLTPAGDDLLVGVLATLRRFDPGGQTLRALAYGVRRDAHRTTDISAHHLRLAAAGAFGESVTGLLDARTAGAARTTVAARTDGVLRTGASSGADAVAGVVLGVRALVPPPDQKAA